MRLTDTQRPPPPGLTASAFQQEPEVTLGPMAPFYPHTIFTLKLLPWPHPGFAPHKQPDLRKAPNSPRLSSH